MPEKTEKRTISRDLLPPGATGISWKGEIYAVGEDGQVTNLAGGEVDLPEDFPTDEQLAENKARATRGLSAYPGGQAIQQHISTGSSGSGTSQREEDKGGPAEDDLSEMTKDDLIERAKSLGLDVKSTGETDTPLRADFEKALRRHAREQAKQQ